METRFVSNVVDELLLAFAVDIGERSAYNNHLVGLVLLIDDFLHLTGLAADDAIFGFEAKI